MTMPRDALLLARLTELRRQISISEVLVEGLKQRGHPALLEEARLTDLERSLAAIVREHPELAQPPGARTQPTV